METLPALSANFGLSPSDVWGLTVDEWSAYIDGLRRIERETR